MSITTKVEKVKIIGGNGSLCGYLVRDDQDIFCFEPERLGYCYPAAFLRECADSLDEWNNRAKGKKE